MKLIKGLVVLGLLATGAQASEITDAVANEARTESYVARDAHRHPVQTLEFFKVQPTDTVVEVWPGGGWYTEILAPLLAGEGKLIAAHFPADTSVGYYQRSRTAFADKLAAENSIYAGLTLGEMSPETGLVGIEDGSVDKVLTFRNVHNWLRSGKEQVVFESFADALKVGGYLGVVEHRASGDISKETMLKSGYMPEAYVIELAENAGFKLVARSEVNANELDTKDHPSGVWSLPPARKNRDDANADKYDAIGESDRMTLLFQKVE